MTEVAAATLPLPVAGTHRGGSFSALIGHAEVPYDVDIHPEAKILYDNVVCAFRN